MQRSEPRPQEPESRNNMPTGFATSGSQPHTQSFEEIYGVPENFLEIEVCLSCSLSCCCVLVVLEGFWRYELVGEVRAGGWSGKEWRSYRMSKATDTLAVHVAGPGCVCCIDLTCPELS